MNTNQDMFEKLKAALVKIQNEGDVHSNSIATAALSQCDMSPEEAFKKTGIYLAGWSNKTLFLVIIPPLVPS